MKSNVFCKRGLGGLALFAIVLETSSFSARRYQLGTRRAGSLSDTCGAVRDCRRHSKTMCLKAKDDEKNEGSSLKVQTWNPFRLLVLRLGLTEPAATSPLNYGKYQGEFTCAYCGAVLFDSNAKYDSGSGWPSYWRSASENAVEYKLEWDNRLECKCKRCSSHLGHVFLDGPLPNSVPQSVLESSPSTDPRSSRGTYLPRFCINGAALRYQPRDDDKAKSSTKEDVSTTQKK